jgi:hypothetical protein
MMERTIAAALVGLLTAAASVALHHITQPRPLKSHCPALIDHYQSTGVPVHVQIKCRGYFE